MLADRTTAPPDPVGTAAARPAANRVARSIEWLALVGLLLAYTKGPVYWRRFESQPPLVGDFLDDTRTQIAFVLAAVPVVIGGLLSWRTLRRDRWFVIAWLTLPALIVLSTIWSVDRERTLEQGVMMCVGCAAALAIGARWSVRALVAALVVSLHIGLVASLWSEHRRWPLQFDTNGDFAGVYFNRNSFGAVAATALLATVWLLFAAVERLRVRGHGRRFDPVSVLSVLAAGSLVAFDGWMWSRSNSATPIVAAAIALTIAPPIVWISRRARNRWPGRETWIGAALVVGVGGTIVTLLGRAALVGGNDKTMTLSGRTLIWQVVWDFIGQRPLLGWGFMGPWRLQPIFVALWHKGITVYEAHSGYLEVLMGLGILGAVALTFVFVTAATAWVRAAGHLDPWRAYVPTTVALYVAILCVTESYIGPNMLPWLLFGAVSFQASQR